MLAHCGGGGSEAGDGGLGGESGSSLDAMAPPDARSCTGDTKTCLFGTVHVDQFTVNPSGLKASLYRVFPSGVATAMDWQIVAKDHTWAFSSLATWAHYYVVIEPGFPARVAPSKGVATRIGPLAVPNDPGAPVDVHVKPVQFDVLEDQGMSSAFDVQAASAHLFDPTTGGEVGSGASVSIAIGTMSAAIPWLPSASAYEVHFTPPPAAQPKYQIATSLTPGAAQTTWNLVADPPQFVGSIAVPAAGATIPAGKDIMVTWPLQAAADYEIVDLFQQKQGAWVRVYTSPQPRAPDEATEIVPAASVSQPGMYLLNVSFTKANCPPIADGCVEASNVANELLTVQ